MNAPLPLLVFVALMCAVLALSLAGCAAKAEPAPAPLPPVVIQGDTLCRTAKPTWSVFDTPDTIAGNVAAAELWDRRCARGKK
jgi:hypothetical protein